jgi:hypothetical protein
MDVKVHISDYGVNGAIALPKEAKSQIASRTPSGEDWSWN